MSYFYPPKKDENGEADAETELKGCVRRLRGPQKESRFEMIDSEATEQERETNEEEPEGDRQAELEAQSQTENPCAPTSTGPSRL